MKRNKKGFTLIELLAVIVILAILILLATPAVVGLMNKAKFNAFKLEVKSIEKITNTAYTLNKDEATQKFGDYNCYTLEWLKENGYTDKNFKNPGIAITSIEGVELIIYNDGNYFYAGNVPDLEDVSYQEFLDVQSLGTEVYDYIINIMSDNKDMCAAYYEYAQ